MVGSQNQRLERLKKENKLRNWDPGLTPEQEEQIRQRNEARWKRLRLEREEKHTRNLLGSAMRWEPEHVPQDVGGIVEFLKSKPWGYWMTSTGEPPAFDDGELVRAISRCIFEDSPPGMADRVCPPEWREVFEAEEELIRRYRAIPPEEHARLTAGMGQPTNSPAGEHAQRVMDEVYGIHDELWHKAIGPAAELDEMSEERESYRSGLIYDRYWETEEGQATNAALIALVKKHPEILRDLPRKELTR